jgi:hypothetical protein
MAFELSLGSAVVWAMRTGLGVAIAGGVLAVIKAISSFKGDSDGGGDDDPTGNDDDSKLTTVRDDPKEEAVLQQQEKKVFSDILGKEVQEQEIGKILTGMKEDFKKIVPAVEEARKKGFENEDVHKELVDLLRNFYDLILTGEKHFSKASAENTLLQKDFETFKKEVETKLKEGHSLKDDIEELDEKMEKINEEFTHLRTGILALHAKFQDNEIKDILAKIVSISSFPFRANAKLDGWNKKLDGYLQIFENRGLKPMSDKRRPSLRSALNAHKKMLILNDEFATKIKEVRPLIEVTEEKPAETS